MIKRLIVSLLCFAFIFSNLQLAQAQDFSINQLPVPGTMVMESAPFVPLALKGLVVNLKKPLEFQFIVDTGKDLQDTASIKDQTNQLVKYFLAGLTIPEGDLWVNLSPYEKNRIVPEALGQTDLGRDLLAQDYILKQLTASLIYPEKDLGKEFWSRVYSKAQAQFGTTNVPVNTFNKVWILPDQAQVFENVNAAYVTKSTLKVMLDEDYTALQKHIPARNGTDSIGSNIVRQIILPAIEKEVNTGKNFGPLRQIYQALILAKWYKETIQNGLLDALYTNKNKVAGVDLNDPAIKEQIYERYLKAYKKGAFNYIKEDPMPEGQSVPRKYFSGGLIWKMDLKRDGAMSAVKNDGAMLTFHVALQKDAAMSNEEILRGKKVLIAEDSIYIRDDLIRFFENKGCHVIAASDGEEALKLYKENTIDLIVTDHGMPYLTGLGLIEAIRDSNKQIPILMIAGQEQKFLNNVRDTFNVAVLQKPTGKQQIIDAAVELLSQDKVKADEMPKQRPLDSAMTVEDAKRILKGKKMLFVDDNEGSRDIHKALFESRYGMSVEIAENGQQALALLEEGRDFDFVLSDLQMPVMNGEKLANMIRNSGKNYAGIKMLIQTSDLNRNDDRIAKGSNVREISKKVETDDLIIAIASELDRAMTESLDLEILRNRKAITGQDVEFWLREHLEAPAGEARVYTIDHQFFMAPFEIVLERIGKGVFYTRVANFKNPEGVLFSTTAQIYGNFEPAAKLKGLRSVHEILKEVRDKFISQNQSEGDLLYNDLPRIINNMVSSHDRLKQYPENEFFQLRTKQQDLKMMDIMNADAWRNGAYINARNGYVAAIKSIEKMARDIVRSKIREILDKIGKSYLIDEIMQNLNVNIVSNGTEGLVHYSIEMPYDNKTLKKLAEDFIAYLNNRDIRDNFISTWLIIPADLGEIKGETKQREDSFRLFLAKKQVLEMMQGELQAWKDLNPKDIEFIMSKIHLQNVIIHKIAGNGQRSDADYDRYGFRISIDTAMTVEDAKRDQAMIVTAGSIYKEHLVYFIKHSINGALLDSAREDFIRALFNFGSKQNDAWQEFYDESLSVTENEQGRRESVLNEQIKEFAPTWRRLELQKIEKEDKSGELSLAQFINKYHHYELRLRAYKHLMGLRNQDGSVPTLNEFLKMDDGQILGSPGNNFGGVSFNEVKNFFRGLGLPIASDRAMSQASSLHEEHDAAMTIDKIKESLKANPVILVVEDDEGLLGQIKKHLAEHPGLEVFYASGQEDAEEQMIRIEQRGLKIGLLITDNTMPQKKGRPEITNAGLDWARELIKKYSELLIVIQSSMRVDLSPDMLQQTKFVNKRDIRGFLENISKDFAMSPNLKQTQDSNAKILAKASNQELNEDVLHHVNNALHSIGVITSLFQIDSRGTSNLPIIETEDFIKQSIGLLENLRNIAQSSSGYEKLNIGLVRVIYQELKDALNLVRTQKNIWRLLAESHAVLIKDDAKVGDRFENISSSLNRAEEWLQSWLSNIDGAMIDSSKKSVDFGMSSAAKKKFSQTDKATVTHPEIKYGGIDLNQIKVKRNGKIVKVQFDPAQLNQLEQGGFEGFTPVITSFQYIKSPFQLLGINANLPERLAKT